MFKKTLRSVFMLAIVCAAKPTLQSQSLYFPPLTGNNWDTLSPTYLGWCTDKIPPLYAFLNQKNTKAFIVLKDGKIVLEKYFGTFTADSAWYWASAGKSLTAMLVGIAQQEGKLNIKDTSSKYLGKGWTVCSADKEEKITIRHQLTMTSGLDDGVPDHYCTIDTCLQYKADAGTRWAYHNGPYTLLDGVVEAATGQTMNAFFNQKIKASTGIAGLFIPSGYNNVFYSKPRMAARYGLLCLNKGNWNGTQILKDTAYFRQMTNTSQQLNKSYGYLWWLNGKSSFMVPGMQLIIPGKLFTNAPSDMFSALGKNGQFINVVPSQNLVMVRMGNEPGGGDVPFVLNDSIWKKLNAVMCTTNKILDKKYAPEVQIYPNPSSGELHILSNEKNFQISIYGVSGKLILEKNNCNGEAHLEHIPAGIYWVRITDQQGDFCNKKLVVTDK